MTTPSGSPYHTHPSDGPADRTTADPPTPSPADVHVASSSGRTDPDLAAQIRTVVAAIAGRCGKPILRMHVRVDRYPDPALPYPVVAQATLNIDGHLVNAHCAAATPTEVPAELRDALLSVIELSLTGSVPPDADRPQPGRRRLTGAHQA